MRPDFDYCGDRRATESLKWGSYDPDVLPMWVADMDLRSPECVISALRERVEHGVFGYATAPPELRETICQRLERLYRWQVSPDEIVFMPGVVTGLNVMCRAFGEPGMGVLVQTPVYPPFLTAPANSGLSLQTCPLTLVSPGRILDYQVDLDAFEAAITQETRIFLLCHPHNPIGREFSAAELRQLVEICERHNLLICSDEIHGDLMLDGRLHVPASKLARGSADRIVTMMAPSKTFNLPGLGCSFAIIQDRELRKRFVDAAEGIVPAVNALGFVAALAAYRGGDAWLAELVDYLGDNRDALAEYVLTHWPAVQMTRPQATYLGWLDFRKAGIEDNIYRFFLRQARVALSDGAHFGADGQGFVRINFGCPRSQLVDALERMDRALGERISLAR